MRMNKSIQNKLLVIKFGELFYVKNYWRRATLGISTNAFARAFDLIPFVAMGLAVDYYQSGNLTGPQFLVDLISTILNSVMVH